MPGGLNGSYFIVQTRKYLFINATAVTLAQDHGKVMQYISPDLLFPILSVSQIFKVFDVKGKGLCGGGGDGVGRGGGGGNELKA